MCVWRGLHPRSFINDELVSVCCAALAWQADGQDKQPSGGGNGDASCTRFRARAQNVNDISHSLLARQFASTDRVSLYF